MTMYYIYNQYIYTITKALNIYIHTKVYARYINHQKNQFAGYLRLSLANYAQFSFGTRAGESSESGIDLILEA